MVTCNLASTAIILYPLNEIQISQIQSNCEHPQVIKFIQTFRIVFSRITSISLIYIYRHAVQQKSMKMTFVKITKNNFIYPSRCVNEVQDEANTGIILGLIYALTKWHTVEDIYSTTFRSLSQQWKSHFLLSAN